MRILLDNETTEIEIHEDGYSLLPIVNRALIAMGYTKEELAGFFGVEDE